MKSSSFRIDKVDGVSDEFLRLKLLKFTCYNVIKNFFYIPCHHIALQIFNNSKFIIKLLCHFFDQTLQDWLFIWKCLCIVLWNFHLIHEKSTKMRQNFDFVYFSWMVEVKKTSKVKSNVLRALENISVQIHKKSSSLDAHSTEFFATEIVNFKLLLFVVMK